MIYKYDIPCGFASTYTDYSQEYRSNSDLLPAFVSASTEASLLFIGRSLNHIRVKGISSSTSPELNLLTSHLQQLSKLTFPINDANFSRVVASIRLSLSQTTLQQLLPLSRVVEILSLLREFFLLGRGDFAIALISEADDKIRSRWRRAENLAHDKRDAFDNIVIKEGEVSAVLARTWAAMGSLQGQDEEQDEDELLELARDLIQLVINKANSTTPSKSPSSRTTTFIAPTPFRNLLLSVPVALTLHIPSPLDLFLVPSDVQIYSSINAFLLSIHRAHLRLTDLWKITALRRDHPAPPGPPYGSSTAGQHKVHTLRARVKDRSAAMRSVWATSSAAVFFLGETEAYLQGEVVTGTWDGFKAWLRGDSTNLKASMSKSQDDENDDEDEDIWLKVARESTQSDLQSQKTRTGNTTTTTATTHDPQTLADAHRRYLAALLKNLLLTTPSFTDPLYHLLQQIDHLVALVHRVHSIWQSLDLEEDEGVVDAFSDFHKEERDVKEQLVVVAGRVKGAIEVLVGCLREVDQEKEESGGWDGAFGELALGEDGAYVPRKVGRVDRLLMKLDFGGWFENTKKRGSGALGSEDEDDGVDIDDYE